MATDGFDTGRFGRLLALIAVVTAIALFTSTQRLEGELLQIGVVAIASVAVLTAMTGILIALSAAYDDDGEPSETATAGSKD
jgi:hypothetical protein